jgi:nitrogen regulatory protein P-II 1
MRFKLILVSVQQSLTEKVVDKAKEAGATGATIIPARGIGSHDKKTFFGLTIEGPVDVVLFLVEEHTVDKIIDNLEKNCRLKEPGVGMVAVIPIDQVAGMDSQLKIFRDQARDKYL